MNEHDKVLEASGVSAERDDDVLQLTLRHPGRRNALTWEMYAQLDDHVREAADDHSLRALVLTGTAADGFAAGTDIRQFEEFAGDLDGLRYERRVGAILAAIQRLPVPTIAVVQGHAVGAGLALAASCDLVIAERGATFGAPIARTLGNCLPAAVVGRLMSRLGTSTVLRMLLTAQLLSAEELAASGFVHRLAEPGEGSAVAAEVLTGIRRSAPLTLRALKETVRRIEEAAPVPDNDDLLALCYGSEDFAGGVAAFLAKRAPVWNGV